MTDYEESDRNKKERSPSFPFIPLKKAIERAQAMFTAHRRNQTRPSAVSDTWGYSPSSSGFMQTIAALKAYGLIDDIGRGEDRRVQLSDLAIRILTDAREGARETATKDAALKPKMFMEYSVIWFPDRPSDAHCLSELTLDRGFTQEAAKLFLRVFDENMSFALHGSPDKTNDVRGVGQMETEREPRKDAKTLRHYTLQAAPGAFHAESSHARVETSQPALIPAATLPLPEGIVTLAIPSGLSDRSVKALKAWIDVIVGLAAEPANDQQENG
jgi:hypothetical protein